MTDHHVSLVARLQPRARLIRNVWIAYWIFLFGLTHIPKIPGLSPLFAYSDLVAHMLTFAVLAIACMLYRLATGMNLRWSWRLKWIAIFAIYGIADELLQPLTGRDCSLYDWLADMVGVLAAMSIFPRIIRRT